MNRADAMGVISKRQYFASIGQRLLLECTDIPIEHIPIAFDFRTKEAPTLVAQGTTVASFSGSNNPWLDLDRLSNLLDEQTVHCTGMDVHHLPDRPPTENWIQHGWLKDVDLQALLSQCSFGVWTDNEGVEPLLGSRTRALFYIWSGLTPIGDDTTEILPI